MIDRPVTEENQQEQAKLVEEAVRRVGALFAAGGRLDDMRDLFVQLRGFFSTTAKAKAAKILKALINQIAETKGATPQHQIAIIVDAVAWCVKEKRTFLKQRMEARLAALYLETGQYKLSLNLIATLSREVKKFDDKLLMIEIYLVESKVFHQLRNHAKAKGALTSARASANSIYCPPTTQAEIDMMAGTLCAEEGDFKTAYSYFYEAYEGYNTIHQDALAVANIKYMLLTKIMLNSAEEVYTIMNGKAGVKFMCEELEAMKAVADAYKARSLHAFDEVFTKYAQYLEADVVVGSHLVKLKANLLEQNLLRIVEPFSCVEVAHVAKLIDLPVDEIEAKLCGMILDKKLSGILDQGQGTLIVYDDADQDDTYETAIETIQELSSVVDVLYSHGKQLTVPEVLDAPKEEEKKEEKKEVIALEDKPSGK